MNNTPIRFQSPVVLSMAIIVMISIYIALDSVFLRAFPGQRLVYALVVLTPVAVFLLGLARMNILESEALKIFAWVLLNIMWALVVFYQSKVYIHWVIGDAITLLLPAVFFLVAVCFPIIYTSQRLLLFFAVCLLVGAVMGALLGIGPNNRFESPATLLFPLAWLYLASTKTSSKLWAAALVGLLAVLAIGAGERTAMIIWLFSGLAVYSLVWPLKRVVLISVLALVVSIVFGAVIFQSVLRDAIDQTRFKQNLDGNVDSSLLTRVNEATDVLGEFRQAGPMVKLFGHGHGAAFRPVSSLTLQNITDDGLVHHVHIGPALVIYRYGIVGVIALLLLWRAVIRSLYRYRLSPPAERELVHVAMALAVLMYLADFFLRNVLADPAFSFVVAGFLFLESRRRILITPSRTE